MPISLVSELTSTSTTGIPRPEYPQPQFKREPWINLNGVWEFEFDDANEGLANHWGPAGRRLGRSILVPFCFESEASGIGDTSFHPQVWYRREFEIPPDWAGKRVLLRFGAVDYHAMVWVNGKPAGEHEGGHTPFSFDITALLREGSNHVVVRAEDPPTDRFIPRGKQHWEEKSASIFYTRTSGIWQTVWLEATGETYLDCVRIDATINGSVSFDARIARPQGGVEFVASVSYQGRRLSTCRGPVEDWHASCGAAVRDPDLWSPGRPALYDVTFELWRGNVLLDRVESYFGFRQVTVEEGNVVLNGEPIYLKFILDQGYWPESIMTPPSDEAIIFDIRATKEMGFNGARKHQKVEDPRYLYWADKMGLLVSSEMANAYLFDDRSVARITREWIEVVQRDMNHPSIVIWVPINESWGVPNLRDKRQQAHLRAMYNLTKSLDQTRLVIDNDGWEHTDQTDLFAIHDYTRSGGLFYERFKNVGRAGVPIPAFAKPLVAPGYQYNGSPVYLSEFGGIAYVKRSEAEIPQDSWGYAGIEPSEESAIARLRGLYEAVAKLPVIKGICYTQLVDVEQEINGLMTYDRKPKFEFRSIRELNDLLR